MKKKDIPKGISKEGHLDEIQHNEFLLALDYPADVDFTDKELQEADDISKSFANVNIQLSRTIIRTGQVSSDLSRRMAMIELIYGVPQHDCENRRYAVVGSTRITELKCSDGVFVATD